MLGDKHIVIRSLAVAASVALAACSASAPAPEAAAGSASVATASGPTGDRAPDQKLDRALFSAAYANIADKYIEQVTVERLALEGLRGLGTIDPAVVAMPQGGALLISHGGEPVGRYRLPHVDDVHGWARLTVSAVEAARGVSLGLRRASAEDIYEAVIDASLSTLDVFSRYAGASEAGRNRARRDGYGGVGLRYDAVPGGLRVKDLVGDSPAARAGVRAGDLITHANGTALAALSADRLRALFHGAPGTLLHLKVQRRGNRPFVARVVRERIVPPTVEVRRRGPVLVTRISSFNQNTAASLAKELRRAMLDKMAPLGGVVLDLRGNPGGLLRQAVEVADLFLKDGRIISTAGRHGDSLQVYDAGGVDMIGGRPLVVLVDGDSASAAEIVASALQDRARALVVGTSSYGKGTVQTVVRLPNDGELTLTWSRLVAPSGYVLHGLGVRPVVCTSTTQEAAELIQAAVDDDGETMRALAAWRRMPFKDINGRHILRKACPPDSHEVASSQAAPSEAAAVDLQVAERLIGEPTLYGRLLGEVAMTASRGQSTVGALRQRVMRR